MNLFDHLTIKGRMILSFAFIVSLFIIFALISIKQMNVLSDLTLTLYGHPLQVSNASLKAKAGVIAMHRSMKDVSIAKTQMAISLAIKQVQDQEKQVYQELVLIQRLILGEQGKHLVEDVTLLFAGWKPIRVEVEEFVLQGDSLLANQITREKGADYVARLERKMLELTDYALTKADGFMAAADKTKNRILMNMLIFISILILLTLVIGFLMSSSILSSISFLQKTMTRITQTGELEKATIVGNNEITSMARHFNGLILRLKEQFWLGEGKNLLNRALSGDLSYDEVLSQCTGHICRQVDACVGVLYGYNDIEETCELKSHYASIKGKQFSKIFKLGQGIVGQVAIEKKAILLENITSKDALVESGTMSHTPEAIFAVPLFYETTLFGVLEIASFEKIDTIKQQYLNSAAKIISRILFAAAQNKRIKHLLDTSQEANEKLQIQTEELQAQTEELQSQAEELQAFNEEFKQQSDELKDQNIELDLQRQQVEEANRLKSEFLSNMSHELRTPLSSVNALSRVLILQAKQKLSDEEVDYLEIIERNGKHLLSLINDILDLSKIEAGKMDVILSYFSINTLIENIMESISPIAFEKNIQLKDQLLSDLPKIESDEFRVHQILQNIIANAIKFTDQGNVAISTRLTGDHIDIIVRDTGIGISSKDLETIFEAFRQVDGATTRKFEGTGLGLSIAYKATKLIGGNIQVSSTIDVGTQFIVSLPVKYNGPEKESTLQARSVTVPDKIVENNNNKTISIVDNDSKTLDPTSSVVSNQGDDILVASTGEKSIERTHKILVVEDNEAAVIQVKKALEMIDICVDVANDGQQALDYIQHTIPQGIILDLMMPNIDGFQVLEILRGTPLTKEIPVLILTAKDLSKHDLKRLSSNNIQQLIQKGDVDKAELLDKIKKMLGNTTLLTDKIVSKQISDHVETEDKVISVPSKSHLKKRQGDPVILVIEDNLDNMVTIKAVLQNGLIIKEAFDGQQGLKMAKKLLPDLILLDIALPKMDGVAVVQNLKENTTTRHIPVIALTAQVMKGDRERIMNAGCDDYVSKPINPETIVKKVHSWLTPGPEEKL